MFSYKESMGQICLSRKRHDTGMEDPSKEKTVSEDKTPSVSEASTEIAADPETTRDSDVNMNEECGNMDRPPAPDLFSELPVPRRSNAFRMENKIPDYPPPKYEEHEMEKMQAAEQIVTSTPAVLTEAKGIRPECGNISKVESPEDGEGKKEESEHLRQNEKTVVSDTSDEESDEGETDDDCTDSEENDTDEMEMKSGEKNHGESVEDEASGKTPPNEKQKLEDRVLKEIPHSVRENPGENIEVDQSELYVTARETLV